MDIVDPQTYCGTGLDGESISILSSDNLDFMNASTEIKSVPDHCDKVESKTNYTKGKLGSGKDDAKRTASSPAQEGQALDDIGRSVIIQMVFLWCGYGISK